MLVTLHTQDGHECCQPGKERLTGPETAKSIYSVKNPADLCVLLSRNRLSSRYSSMLFFWASAIFDTSCISGELYDVARAAHGRLTDVDGVANQRKAQLWPPDTASPRMCIARLIPAILKDYENIW